MIQKTPSKIALPEAVQPVTIAWPYAVSTAIIHLLALLAFVPWFFTWTGFAFMAVGYLLMTPLGINLGFHRLLTHRGMTCPKWFEYFLATLGVCALQDSPARWVAIHRMHHQSSDEHEDPHSPLAGFWWGHFAWLFVKNREHIHAVKFERYARDLLKDPYYWRLEKGYGWMYVYLAHALLFFGIGLAIGWIASGTAIEALRVGLSVFVWGVLLRTVIGWHATWSVNSLSHIWGYQNYDTKDNSRNNWFVSLIAGGEGWHNNHHADQLSAQHGHRWWEFDLTWWMISFFEKIGLVNDVARPRCMKSNE